MKKYINNGQVDVDGLTRAWKEMMTSHYADKPRLFLHLTSTPLTFETEGESLMILFDVANDAQKEWLEIKMIPEIFESITGINEISIKPIVKEPEDVRVYQPPLRGAVSLEDMNEVKSIVKDLEIDIK
jgi:hypothetical protein